MPFNNIQDYDPAIPANNSNIGGSNIAEGCPPSGINDALRNLCSQLKRAVANQGADILAAPTTDIGAATGQYVRVTGSQTITSFGTAPAGTMRFVEFYGGNIIIASSANIILPGNTAIEIPPLQVGSIGVFVSRGSGVWRLLSYHTNDPGALALPPSYISGFRLANNASDPANALDINPGYCRSSLSDPFPTNIALRVPMTKILNSPWIQGTNRGGLDIPSKVANTTYHVYVIFKRTSGEVDILFSKNPTQPLMPFGWNYFRRIGSLYTDSATALVRFTQQGDEFLLNTPAIDVSAAAWSNIETLVTLSVPNGIKVTALSTFRWYNSVSILTGIVTSPDQADTVPNLVNQFNMSSAANVGSIATYHARVRTNASRQVRVRTSANTGLSAFVHTHGWIDQRDKDL